MNVKLLRKVKRHILAEPKRLDMDFVASEIIAGPRAPRCGTVGCIAGWSALLASPVIPATVAGRLALMGWDSGKKALELTESEVNRLFNEPWLVYGPRKRDGAVGWPEKFAKAYLGAKTPRQRAGITARRIEHFIKTKGRE
jgi:hypothetical protein